MVGWPLPHVLQQRKSIGSLCHFLLNRNPLNAPTPSSGRMPLTSGASTIFGISHHTALIAWFFIFFPPQDQVLHISLIMLSVGGQHGLDRCCVLKSVPPSKNPYSRLHGGVQSVWDANRKHCELRGEFKRLLRMHKHKSTRARHHSWKETVIAPVLKQTWSWYYEMPCLSSRKGEARGWGGDTERIDSIPSRNRFHHNPKEASLS